jgi:hypothetical protein
MSVRPVVDGIERKLSGRLEVIRLNLQEPAGAQLAADMGANFTPTFVLYDGQGLEGWRSVFQIDLETVERALTP